MVPLLITSLIFLPSFLCLPLFLPTSLPFFHPSPFLLSFSTSLALSCSPRAHTSPSPSLPASRTPSDLSFVGGGVGPFLPLTPECAQAMMLAKEAGKRAEEIRMELTSAIDHTERLQRSAHESVNEGLVNKLAMTVTLTVSDGGIEGQQPVVSCASPYPSVLLLFKQAAACYFHISCGMQPRCYGDAGL